MDDQNLGRRLTVGLLTKPEESTQDDHTNCRL